MGILPTGHSRHHPFQGTFRRVIPLLLFFALCLTIPHVVQAQVQLLPDNIQRGTPSGSSSISRTNNQNNASSNSAASSSVNDTNYSQTDTSATKGLIYNKEEPDSVLRQKVFLFHRRPQHIWINEVWNPTLDPTGVQFYDPLDALNGNYYLGKGSLGHPHVAVYTSLADGLRPHLQPDLYPGYAIFLDNLDYFQTITPFSALAYGGSLANEHSLQVLHTQNIMPGWNASFRYRLLNPEGIYTSSGALNHYLDATTNYFSPDSRLQVSAAIAWQSFKIDENGGLLYDSIFTQRLLNNWAGIPVVLSGSGTLQHNLAATTRISFSLERQSDTYRHRDSLALIQVNDSTIRTDTISVVDTIHLHNPHVLNLGVIAMEVNTDRQKRIFTDSTLWREHTAALFWTNDAYTDYRWRNPLKITLGLQPRLISAVIYGDTATFASLLNPFAHIRLVLWHTTIAIDAETHTGFTGYIDGGNADRRLATSLLIPFDSAGLTTLCIEAVTQNKAPDWLVIHDYMTLHTGSLPASQNIERFAVRFRHKDIANIGASASHLDRNLWYDTSLNLHEGTRDLWLLQAALTLRLKAGLMHFDMQQLLQYSTDTDQLPVPLWASKNSLYADFSLFSRTLRVQVGADVRYHTPYLAPAYIPEAGLFVHQDEQVIGGYLWADAFVNIQVKRVSAYLKAGHVNALWETPATYFLLPHYPGQGFGMQWGLIWYFFD